METITDILALFLVAVVLVLNVTVFPHASLDPIIGYEAALLIQVTISIVWGWMFGALLFNILYRR